MIVHADTPEQTIDAIRTFVQSERARYGKAAGTSTTKGGKDSAFAKSVAMDVLDDMLSRARVLRIPGEPVGIVSMPQRPPCPPGAPDDDPCHEFGRGLAI